MFCRNDPTQGLLNPGIPRAGFSSIGCAKLCNMAYSPSFRLIVELPQGGRVSELPEYLDSEEMGKHPEILELVYKACMEGRAKLRCAACDLSTNPQRNTQVLLRKRENITPARWPRSQHDCAQFGRGQVKTITTTPDQLPSIFQGAATKQGQFNLSLPTGNCAVQPKPDPREIADNISGRRPNHRLKSKLSRRLSGMMIGMIEEAELNRWPRYPNIVDRWGIIKAITGAVNANANFSSALKCPIIFPEVQFSGLSQNDAEKIREDICTVARMENSSKRMAGCAVIVGRFVSAQEKHETVHLQVVGLRSCRLEVTKKLWNSSIKSYGQPIPFHGSDGDLESLLIGVIAPSPSGSLQVRHIAWSRIDRNGVPFFESEFESPIAQECYRRGIEFLKPCHLRLALGDRNVWSDYILRTRSGKFLIIEVDPTGSASTPDKRNKAILYDKHGLWLYSWDPRAEPDCSKLSIWDEIEAEAPF